jgi:hypothetical protein
VYEYISSESVTLKEATVAATVSATVAVAVATIARIGTKQE